LEADVRLQIPLLAICAAVTAADCAWNAPPTSDFITFSAGESVARSKVEQARDIWPPAALDNDLEFDASRLLAPPATAPASSTSSQDGFSGSSGSLVGSK
jgi:hypothetical protein